MSVNRHNFWLSVDDEFMLLWRTDESWTKLLIYSTCSILSIWNSVKKEKMSSNYGDGQEEGSTLVSLWSFYLLSVDNCRLIWCVLWLLQEVIEPLAVQRLWWSNLPSAKCLSLPSPLPFLSSSLPPTPSIHSCIHWYKKCKNHPEIQELWSKMKWLVFMDNVVLPHKAWFLVF